MPSTKVLTAYSNFARGQIDQDLDGRFDLPIYRTGTLSFRNFISNFKGNAIFRSGWENILEWQDAGLIEFKFSENQNYIVVMYANTFRFLSYDSAGNFGWVLNGGSPLEVVSPYTLEESKEIALQQSFTQNFDNMIITHPDHPPQELRRLAADDFQLVPHARQDDPFATTFGSTVNISAITQATQAQITTAAAHGLAVGDMIQIRSAGGMTKINNYTAGVSKIISSTVFTVNIDTTEFTAYTSGGNIREVTAGNWPARCLFYKQRLYFAATDEKITTLWASESANFGIFTLSSSVTATSALQFTLAEMSSKIDWLFGGQNSLIVGSSNLIIAVNGGGVGTPIDAENIDTIVTSADGCNSAAPLSKDDFIFYVTNDARNMLYFQYDLLTETFTAQDANLLARDLTISGLLKMRYVRTREDLIFALKGNGELVSCNFNNQENVIGWHPHISESTGNDTFVDIAQISDNDGNQQLFCLINRNGTFYIERQAEYVEFSKRKDFFTDALETPEENQQVDDEAFYRMIAEELNQCIFLDNSSKFNNLQEGNQITYDEGAGTITATTPIFIADDVGKQIAYKTTTGYESGRFEITAFTSTTVVEVTVLQTPTTNVYSNWYLTFDTITGLDRFNGQTVSVVTDGGYLDDFEISGGQLELENQVSTIVIGYSYRGEIASFVLGFQFQTDNTQTTVKAIARSGIRANNTAGGEFGSTPYTLEPIQELGQTELNYLPPLPINTTKYIDYTDDNQFDKQFYVIQDAPLPMTVTAVMIDVKYALEG